MRSTSIPAVFLAASFLPAAAQERPVILEVQVENHVNYGDDNPGPSQVGRTPGPVPLNTATMAINYTAFTAMADVIAINGSPVKGVLVARANNVRISPTPPPGFAIGDVGRGAIAHWGLEFVKPDGGAIGSLFFFGLLPGDPAPGSPPGSNIGTLAIVGGTGAFLGARGTLTGAVGNTIRGASMAEDPSMRRINGGGRSRWLIQLFPMFRPEVLIGPNGPIIFHNEYQPVTAANPARSGEVLIVYAKGLGPTTPSFNPGEPFPDGPPYAAVTSPVEVLVNGRSAPAINQLGLPRTTDMYRVDFRVPDNTEPGEATIQLSAAWIKGAAVSIPVR